MGGSVTLADLRRESAVARDHPESFVALETACLWLERENDTKRLAVLAPPANPILRRFAGRDHRFRTGHVLKLCPADAANAASLRSVLPALRPVPLGLATSAGFGDRLGLATPGHVRSLHRVVSDVSDRAIAPIFAQQSIREMGRTGRSPVDVLTDATWGAFQAGWRGPVGADADHLKTTEDIDAASDAGYSLFTIDPGAFVDDEVATVSRGQLQARLEALPWDKMESSPADLRRRYAGKVTELEDRQVVIDETALMRAAAKYGGAIAHVHRMYRRLAEKGRPFELEISVDETETPTSHAEHIYIAGELRRLGVRWISLAPRFVGRFEKGIDYIGDLDALCSDFEGHAAIARGLGPYKLSLHSGSDKFTVYPLLAEATHGLVHLKTAGTSYLEALRVAARLDPNLFRAMLQCARDHYLEDRATYHVSAQLERVPQTNSLSDEHLPDLLERRDARQVLHVTFGSTLVEFRQSLLELLQTHQEAYSQGLETHFVRHLEPFARTARSAQSCGELQ
ncbi:MAG TPA: tagaturonate epimerase family protein [Chloroflexota bacterium]